jgi:RNA polymerase sigma-70 factor (ECF subfamily)
LDVSAGDGQAELPMMCRADRPEALLARMAAGDRGAFKQLYDETAPRLFAVALRILRDNAAAEDAVQEAYLRIWRKAAGFDPKRGAALAWMGVIARNAALDLARSRRQTEGLQLLDTLDFAVEAVEPPDARLGQCLKRLSPDHARAITIMYTNGMSHSELAEHLSVPLGTAKAWVRRGTASLRECMAS